MKSNIDTAEVLPTLIVTSKHFIGVPIEDKEIALYIIKVLPNGDIKLGLRAK